MSELTPKQALFVVEYLKDKNATQAAIRAGYSVTTAKAQGSRLLTNVGIATELQKRLSKVVGKLDISVERILQERARLAFYDPRKLLDEFGQPKPIHELDEDTAAAITGFEVDPEKLVTKIKTADKDKSLSALEKHLGMYRDTGGEGALNIIINLA